VRKAVGKQCEKAAGRKQRGSSRVVFSLRGRTSKPFQLNHSQSPTDFLRLLLVCAPFKQAHSQGQEEPDASRRRQHEALWHQ
jgi:hypothetical protein